MSYIEVWIYRSIDISINQYFDTAKIDITKYGIRYKNLTLQKCESTIYKRNCRDNNFIILTILFVIYQYIGISKNWNTYILKYWNVDVSKYPVTDILSYRNVKKKWIICSVYKFNIEYRYLENINTVHYTEISMYQCINISISLLFDISKHWYNEISNEMYYKFSISETVTASYREV